VAKCDDQLKDFKKSQLKKCLQELEYELDQVLERGQEKRGQEQE
jgi:hypothetical protein